MGQEIVTLNKRISMISRLEVQCVQLQSIRAAPSRSSDEQLITRGNLLLPTFEDASWTPTTASRASHSHRPNLSTHPTPLYTSSHTPTICQSSTFHPPTLTPPIPTLP